MNQIRVRRRRDAPVPPLDERQVRRELAWAAGAEAFQHRDPLAHVTEHFQQTFDLIGRRRAAALYGGVQAEAAGEHLPPPSPSGMAGGYRFQAPARQDLLLRFSEIAFQRGTLAGGVIRGTGQMLLFSCLKTTVAQSQPACIQQRRLFEGRSRRCGIPGHSATTVVYNRGFTDSAVGLVVDTLQDARSTVETLADLAAGKSPMGEDGAGTLRRMYPFLDVGETRALLAEYETRLRETSDPQTRQVLQHAIVHTRALLEKLAQMRAAFLDKLRFLSGRASQALEVFEEPGFPAALYGALVEAPAGEAPPPDGEAPPEEPDGPPGEEEGPDGPDG